MRISILGRAAVFALAALSFVGCGDDDDDKQPSTANKTIAEIASSDPRFTTLVSALQATGLDATLAGSGTFTVFAPTNDAFAALPGSANLDTATLKTVLEYHVIAGSAIRASAITDSSNPATVQGGKLSFRKEGSSVIINGVVQVTTADIVASNGVLHVVDAVLLPIAFPGNVTQAVSAYPRLSTLRQAVVAAGLDDDLAGAAALTVFAPTNTAFAALPSGTLASLLDAANVATLRDVLSYHVVGATLNKAAIAAAAGANGLGEATVPTLIDTRIKATVAASGVTVNDANVIYTDIVTTNGVIHLLDKVLTIPGDIVAVATSAGFSSLVGAVSAQGLAPTLTYSADNTTSFTVFAPTNAAFEALGSSAPTGQDLTNVLLYHVIPNVIDANAAFVATASGPATVATAYTNNSVQLTRSGQTLRVNGIDIATTDVIARNGIIHVIGTVLTPAP